MSFSNDSMRIYCIFEGDSTITLISSDPPDNYEDVNFVEDFDQISPLFASFSQGLSSIEASQLSPQLLGAFLLACIEKNNEKHRIILEKQGKSADIKIKEPLSLDIREQSLDYLYKIIKIALSKKINEKISIQVLTSGLHLIRAHLLGSKNFPQIEISKDLKLAIYESLQEILSTNYDIHIKTEAGRTIGECFEVFFAKSEEQLPFLYSSINDYRRSLNGNAEDTQIIKAMIAHVSQPILLFQTFALNGGHEAIIKYFDLLIETALETSKVSLVKETDLTTIMNLLDCSLKCLVSQFCISDFETNSQKLLLSISLKLLNCSSTLLQEVKMTKKDAAVIIKNTLIDNIVSTFFMSLILCRLDLLFLTEIITPALLFLENLKTINIPLPEISSCKVYKRQTYESEHPYPNSSDTTYSVKVPFAQKYFLTFDPLCATEANCDTLQLFSDEAKTNLLYN